MPIERRGMRALLIWCQRVTADYRPKVKVEDFTGSFRDGLAFCAIIHHFRPDLIGDFSRLESSDILSNNRLAFDAAERELDVPALLDPEDMDVEEPDKFSVVTYLSQLYHLFKDEDGSRMMGDSSATTVKTARVSESSESDSLLQSSSDSDSSSPLGTPVVASKKSSSSFNRQALIDKYGEEIFSVSKDREAESEEESKDEVIEVAPPVMKINVEPPKEDERISPSPRSDSPMVRSKFASSPGGNKGVAAICRGIEERMKVFEKAS